mmetsp:Transcript_24389/g.60925  ORF Transcript_24389/g.60925 Transcript_24389/m.60925 type:complete len:247 (-) Transcript_24389:5978-6718(-)
MPKRSPEAMSAKQIVGRRSTAPVMPRIVPMHHPPSMPSTSCFSALAPPWPGPKSRPSTTPAPTPISTPLTNLSTACKQFLLKSVPPPGTSPGSAPLLQTGLQEPSLSDIVGKIHLHTPAPSDRTSTAEPAKAPRSRPSAQARRLSASGRAGRRRNSCAASSQAVVATHQDSTPMKQANTASPQPTSSNGTSARPSPPAALPEGAAATTWSSLTSRMPCSPCCMNLSTSSGARKRRRRTAECRQFGS